MKIRQSVYPLMDRHKPIKFYPYKPLF